MKDVDSAQSRESERERERKREREHTHRALTWPHVTKSLGKVSVNSRFDLKEQGLHYSKQMTW